MKKKIFASVFTLALAAGICGNVYAAKGNVVLKIDDPVIKVDGETQTIDTPPVIIDSRTFVPVRAVVEALGGKADWRSEEKKAVLTRGRDTVELTIGSTTAKHNEQTDKLDAAPVIIDGRTMLPLRYIAESFGFAAEWDAETKTIYVSRYDDIDEQTNYDYIAEHIGTDGNRYLLVGSNYVAVDENGRTVDEYTDEGRFCVPMKDTKGRKCELFYDNGKNYIKNADGTKIDLNENDDFDLTDKDGNKYIYTFVRTNEAVAGCYIVQNQKGDIVNRYYSNDEFHSFFKDKSGREVIFINSKDEKPDNGVLLGDGKYVQFLREYNSTYVDKSNNFYGEINSWFCVLKKTGGTSDEALMSDFYDLFTDELGNEYKAYFNDNKQIVKNPDGKEVTLTKDKDVPDESSGSEYDFFTYYNGSDGKTYILDPNGDYTVKDEGGKETTLKSTAYVYESRNPKDGVYKLKHNFATNRYTLTKPDGKSEELTETVG